MHFPNRDFVLLSHLAFNGLISMDVEGGGEPWDVGDVENLDDRDAQRRIEVWRNLE
jgi:hypothetical protein